MKTYNEIVQESKVNVLVKKTCCICGTCVEFPQNENSWETKFGFHDVLETRVELKEGVSYPEDSHGEIKSFDLCPKCFVEKLIPWFESQGAKVQESEWEY